MSNICFSSFLKNIVKTKKLQSLIEGRELNSRVATLVEEKISSGSKLRVTVQQTGFIYSSDRYFDKPVQGWIHKFSPSISTNHRFSEGERLATSSCHDFSLMDLPL